MTGIYGVLWVCNFNWVIYYPVYYKLIHNFIVYFVFQNADHTPYRYREPTGLQRFGELNLKGLQRTTILDTETSFTFTQLSVAIQSDNI